MQVLMRKAAAAKLGLTEAFENSLIHYLLPTHPLFYAVYATYVIMGVNLAYVVRHDENGRFRQIIFDSFKDLKNLSGVCRKTRDISGLHCRKEMHIEMQVFPPPRRLCLSAFVCLFVRQHYAKTIQPIFTKFSEKTATEEMFRFWWQSFGLGL